MATVATAAPSTPTGPACGSTQRAASTQRISNANSAPLPLSHFFLARAAPAQRNATQHQRNPSPGPAATQHNSTQRPASSAQLKRERSERAARQINTSASTVSTSAPAENASRCRDFYYLVTMMCRFKVLCLLTSQSFDGVSIMSPLKLPHPMPGSLPEDPFGDANGRA